MFGSFKNLFDGSRRVPRRGEGLAPEPHTSPPVRRQDGADRKQTFAKVFRYRLPDGQTVEPASVEVVGSFNHWQRVPLTRDSKVDGWHVTIHHIPGNRTHHYMLLLDGKPAFDITCDGLAVPHGYIEEQYQLLTDKGYRILMIFGQTK